MAIIPADEKVFMVDKRTNTTYGGSQALQDMQQWYTMQDVADSVQPYKVFTALLTQNGGDDQKDASSGTLIIGKTYRIDNNSGGADFTVVGAPTNEEGTYFIATGTTPDWGNDIANLWFNNGAPIATVLENTIGNIWFSYNSVGAYTANSDALFTSNKTWNTIIPGELIYNANYQEMFFNDSSTFNVYTSSESVLTNGILYQTPIEIRVYN